MDQRQTIVVIVVGVAVVAALALRMSRMMKPQPLDLVRIWIVPALLGVGAAASVAQLEAPGAAFYLFLAGAIALGGGFGWLRAKTVSLTLDPAGGRRVIAQSSAAAVIFLVGLILVRGAVRWAVMSGAVALPISQRQFDTIFIVFAAALFVARTAELTIRARQILGRA